MAPDPLILSLISLLFSVVALGIIVSRHEALATLRPLPPSFRGRSSWTPLSERNHGSSSSALAPQHYTLFVLGSGGHTAEMLAMIERSIRPEREMVRRYVISAGDRMSRAKVLDLEARLSARFRNSSNDNDGGPGKFDVMTVRRARVVHQSWLTTPFTTLLSIASTLSVLLADNENLACPAWPSVIVTNGPGTGLVFVAVAHILRLFGFARPARSALRTVYVESFAKVKTLSLTGKLLYRLDLADVFIVQHRSLALQYPRAVFQPYFVVTPVEPHVPMIPSASGGEDDDTNNNSNSKGAGGKEA